MLPAARAVVFALSLLSAAAIAAQLPEFAEGGYAGSHSVAAGGSIAFHIATSVTPFQLEIVNLAEPTEVLHTIGGLASAADDCTGKWESGCAWPVTTTFAVPVIWGPGFYAARFPTSRGTRHVFFVVRAPSPGAHARIALLQNSNTDVAYNDWGGKSVYDTRSTDGQRAAVVSFDRPYRDDFGFSRIREWELPMVLWLRSQGIAFEVLTDDDMEAGLPLDGYETLIIAGHSEYWSLNARRHLEDYIANGGNLAIFGGNTMWWQVRADLESRQMTVYKDAQLDPMTGFDDDRVTTNFYDWPVFNPENTILGASFLNAGYVNKDPDSSWERLPLEERTPYTVKDADHWVFEGTGLTDGAAFGRTAGAIEVDGAIFNTMPDGSVVVEGSDGTPLNTEILATLPASYGYGTIGIFTTPAGGAVFNGAARDWPIAIARDPVIERITRNVIDRLSNGASFEFIPPRATPNRVEDRFNTPVPAEGVLPGWQYDMLGFSLAPECAVEGPTGLRLAGTRWTQVIRTFAGQSGVSAAAANLWINADSLTRSARFPAPLLELVDYRGDSITYVAALEIMDLATGRALRVTAFQESGEDVSTPWVVMSPGWQSVQMSWSAPGEVTLNVSGRKATAFNPDSGVTVNALMLEYAGSYSTGSVCVDHLQFRESFAPPSTATSTITVSPAPLPADGASTAQVSVRLIDDAGDPLVNGGDDVVLTTTNGTLSPVIDLGDGTYGATFTAGTVTGTATVTAMVNDLVIEETASIVLEGGASAITVQGPDRAIAGDAVRVTVQVLTGDGAPATHYRGTIGFTASGESVVLPGPYTFTEGDAGISEFEMRALAPGSITITATDTEHASLSASVVIDVDAPTSTSLAAAPSGSYSGQEVTLTARVTSSAEGTVHGTVTFFDGATAIGSAEVEEGTATFVTRALAEGTHSLVAKYGGDDDWLPSTSASITHVVRAPDFGAPAGFAATATSLTSVELRWSPVEGAAHYQVFRRATGGGFVAVGTTSLPSYLDSGLAARSAYLYHVRAVAQSGTTSANSATDDAVTVMFTNDPLAPRKTTIKADHITELRTAIEAYRRLAGLPPVTFTDSSLRGKPMRTAHVGELRSALDEARSSLSLTRVAFTDPTLPAGTPVKAVHVQELREALK